MRLSWNDARNCAAAFAGEWPDASYEKGETHSIRADRKNRPSVIRTLVKCARACQLLGQIAEPVVLAGERTSVCRPLHDARGKEYDGKWSLSSAAHNLRRLRAVTVRRRKTGGKWLLSSSAREGSSPPAAMCAKRSWLRSSKPCAQDNSETGSKLTGLGIVIQG